nr:MAG TPA: tail protein [Caudoviricetes sp.]
MDLDLTDLLNSARKQFDKLTDTQGAHLTPVAELTINGQAFGTQTMSRIISVEMTDKRGFEADELTIELDDRDGAIAIPQTGDKITLKLGYAETGVVDLGEYLFTEFSHSGSPDTLHITAIAADLAETFAEQKEKSWHKQTLYQIVETIAKQNGYTGDKCKIATQYQAEKIDHIDQTGESDSSFLSRLAEQYGAIATVKHGVFLFTPEGNAQTVSGAAIPELVITRQAGDRHNFTYSATNSYNAVRAYYTDKKTGKRKEVIVSKDNLQADKKTISKTHVYKRPRKDKKTGKIIRSQTTTKTVSQHRRIDSSGLKIKTLRHLYASEATAWNGAAAAFKKLQRGAAEFSITLATGRPDLSPETPVSVSGFKVEIDAEKWLIVEVQHHLDDGGYTSSLKLEARLDLDS